MAQPVGDERTARTVAVDGAGAVRTAPGPIHPADLAEEAARRAVEGLGIADQLTPHRDTDARPE